MGMTWCGLVLTAQVVKWLDVTIWAFLRWITLNVRPPVRHISAEGPAINNKNEEVQAAEALIWSPSWPESTDLFTTAFFFFFSWIFTARGKIQNSSFSTNTPMLSDCLQRSLSKRGLRDQRMKNVPSWNSSGMLSTCKNLLKLRPVPKHLTWYIRWHKLQQARSSHITNWAHPVCLLKCFDLCMFN